MNCDMKLCTNCGHWTKVEHSLEVFPGFTCKSCGKHNYDYQSTISERTFDVIKADKKTKTIIKLNKERERNL